MPRQKKQKLLGLGLPANLLREFIDLSYKGNNSIAPEGFSIDAPLSDSRVKVYKKIGSNQVIITHRGSVGLQDWWDNAKFLVAGKVKNTKSFKLHKERQLKAVEKYGKDNNLIGIGHSRAGLYLQELQKDPATKLNEIVTYNKAVGFYDALRTNPAEQTDVKVKNDFVSLLSGLQKRPKKMVEIEATKNPLDFNAAHQPAELEKLGETFIGLENEPMEGSGRAPSPKTLEQLKKVLKTLEGKLEKINKGKVYKTTNKDKVSYDISYTKARIKNHETKGEDLIITKKKKYGNELPAKAKAVKPKAVKPKKEVKPEPKKEEPKKQLLLEFKEIIEEPKKEESKKEEHKKEEPKSVKKGKSIKTADEVKNEFIKIFLEGDLEWINEALISVTNLHDFDILNNDDRMKQMKNAQTRVFRNKYFKELFIDKYNSLDNCKEIMCKYGINSKAEFRKWIVKNHPDKGGTIGDTEFKQLIKCAVKEKYCKPEPKMILKELEPKKEEPKEKKKPKKEGGIFGFSAEEKEARKKEKAEKRAKFDAEKKARSEKMKEFTEALNLIKKKKQAKKEAIEAPKAEAEHEAETEAETEPIEGGIFGWSDKEKADKAERKMLRAEYYKTHNRQQNANYTFDKKARAKWKKEFYAKNTAPKAVESVEAPKTEEDAEQEVITETEPNMEGSGYRKSYIEEIANPVNPMFAFKSTLSVPMFIEPENEYLIIDEMYGGSAADMLGMNCYDGKCFNPVWEKEKIKRQILSEYKIWYWPWGTPPAGHIRMPWLNAMVEERYKPLYDEFVARRNVNIGLDANASKDDFGRQMFSNLTDALSYVPVLNLPTTIALSAASAVADIKKEPVEPIEPEPIEPDEIDTD